jgi:hypothetical protein
MLDWEEDKAVGICLEEQFGSKVAFAFCNLVLRCFVTQWWRLLGFSRGHGVGSVGADFLPIIAVVVDEVRDLAKGLVRDDVLERHDDDDDDVKMTWGGGMIMCGFLCVGEDECGGGDELFLVILGAPAESKRS